MEPSQEDRQQDRYDIEDTQPAGAILAKESVGFDIDLEIGNDD